MYNAAMKGWGGDEIHLVARSLFQLVPVFLLFPALKFPEQACLTGSYIHWFAAQ